MTADPDSPTESALPPTQATDPAVARLHTPGPLKRFWWDLLPANTPDRLLPRQGGLKLTQDPDVSWITDLVASEPAALDQARRAHDIARSRADAAEAKANAHVASCLTILVTALALAGYQLDIIRGRHLTWLWLLPAVLALTCLSLAVITGLEVQRPGLYQAVGVEALGMADTTALQGLVQEEERGRRYADATASYKVNALMQSRAWLSRALVAMMLSAAVALWFATKPTPKGGNQAPPNPTATTAPTRLTSTTRLAPAPTTPPTTAPTGPRTSGP